MCLSDSEMGYRYKFWNDYRYSLDSTNDKSVCSLLKNKLYPTKYDLQILPSEQDIKTIKYSRTLPVVTLQREYLMKEINNLWVQYRQYLFAVKPLFWHVKFGTARGLSLIPQLR